MELFSCFVKILHPHTGGRTNEHCMQFLADQSFTDARGDAQDKLIAAFENCIIKPEWTVVEEKCIGSGVAMERWLLGLAACADGYGWMLREGYMNPESLLGGSRPTFINTCLSNDFASLFISKGVSTSAQVRFEKFREKSRLARLCSEVILLSLQLLIAALERAQDPTVLAGQMLTPYDTSEPQTTWVATLITGCVLYPHEMGFVERPRQQGLRDSLKTTIELFERVYPEILKKVFGKSSLYFRSIKKEVRLPQLPPILI